MSSQKREEKKVPHPPDHAAHGMDRRRFLHVAGKGLLAGLALIAGVDALAQEPKPKPDAGKLVAQADKKGPLLAQNGNGGAAVAAPKLAELEGIALSELQDLAAKSGHAVVHEFATYDLHSLTIQVSVDSHLVTINTGVWTNGRDESSVGFSVDGRELGGVWLRDLTRLCNEEGRPFRFVKMFLDIYPSDKLGTMIDVYVIPVGSQGGEMVQGRPLALVPFVVGTKRIGEPVSFRID